MNRKQKNLVVENIHDRLKKAKAVFVTDFTGINVEALSRLRRELKGAGMEYRVVKNTLIYRALQDTSMESVKDNVAGPSGLTISYKDPVTAARVLKEFSKLMDKPFVRWGILGDKAITVEQVFELSSLPAREVLLSQLLAVMKGTPTNLVHVLSGVMRNFMGILTAIADKKEKEN